MTFDRFRNILETVLPETTEKQFGQFASLDALYRDWNAKINVISRKDIDELYSHHILHSLGIALYVRQQMPELYREWIKVYEEHSNEQHSDNAAGICLHDNEQHDNEQHGGNSLHTVQGQKPPYKILDLGCGGGFPGIPLAIMFPNVSFTLCDSIGKKITVAREVASAAGLKNVTAVNARAESIEGKFNWVVSRAVTSLDKFIPWVRGKYTDGIMYLKGGELDAEIAAALRNGSLDKNAAVKCWPLDSVLTDEWFKQKKLVVIKK